MNIQRLAPLLNVEDVPRSIAFYREHLGFQVVSEWESGGRVRWASLEAHGIVLMLNEPDEICSGERRARGTYGDAVFYFTVDDVNALHRRLKHKQIPVGSLRDEHYGMREFYVRDPDGYELGFGTPITAPEVTT